MKRPKNKAEDFIGTSIINKKGNVLFILDFHDTKEKSGERKFKVVCSECSKDLELFPEGYFVSTKTNLRANKTPCWCIKSKPDIRQAEIITKRIINNSPYEFISIDFYEKKNSPYTVTLRCVEHDKMFNILYSTLISIGTKGCDSCFKDTIVKACGKDDNHFINVFMSTGKFQVGTVFTRNINKTDIFGNYVYWDYTCPVCSNDEYVKNGLCSGIFTSTTSNLRAGCRSCRCRGKQAKWTAEQRTYQVEKLVKSINGVFNGWVDKYENSDSRFYWTCEKGHLCTCKCEWAFYDLKCSACSSKGFSKELPANFYVVKWFREEGDFIKFGITNFSTEERIKSQQRWCGLHCEVLHEFHFEHGIDAWILEQDYVKKSVPLRYVTKDIMPDGYTETTSCENLEIILKIVNKYINNISC